MWRLLTIKLSHCTTTEYTNPEGWNLPKLIELLKLIRLIKLCLTSPES